MVKSRRTALTVLPSGMMLPEVDARFRRNILRQWFEQAGGLPKLLEVTKESSENYLTVFKVYAKGVEKPAVIVQSSGTSTEDMLEELDRRATGAMIINPDDD